MKKKLFLGLLAAAAVSFTACQKDEVISEIPQENAIGFGTYVGRDAQTKANVIYETELRSQGFGVFAYHTESSDYNMAEDAITKYSPNFMYNQNVTYDNGWTYQPVKYWPNTTDKISFFAYAPYTTNPTAETNITNFSGESSLGNPTLNFTVKNEVDEQIDLLYAEPLLNKTKTNIANTENKVKFTFKHALSKIGFKVKTESESQKVTVNSINLSGKFITSGTCNLKDGSFSVPQTSTPNPTYSLTYDNSEDKTATNNAEEVIADEGYIMIIPKDFSQETEDADKNITIIVEYTIQVIDLNINGGVSSGTTYTKSGIITGFKFEKGKAYTFILTLKPDVSDAIVFDVAEITDWDTQSPAGDIITSITWTDVQ